LNSIKIARILIVIIFIFQVFISKKKKENIPKKIRKYDKEITNLQNHLSQFKKKKKKNFQQIQFDSK